MASEDRGDGLTRRQALRTGVGAGVAVAATMVTASATSAQTPAGATPTAGQPTATKLVLTESGAMAVLQAALAKAREIGVPEVAAVVDDSGSLKAFARMDGTSNANADLAVDKAYTAAAFKAPTDKLAKQLGSSPVVAAALMRASHVIVLAGGQPLMSGTAVIGAVGCSGGTGEQDQTCAQAGAAALP